MYGICGRKITTYTVIYSVYEWFWPTLLVCIECRRFKAALQKSWEFGCLDAAQRVCLLQLQELGVWLFRCSTECAYYNCKSWEFGCLDAALRLDAAQRVCLLQLQELGVWLRCSTESVPITVQCWEVCLLRCSAESMAYVYRIMICSAESKSIKMKC